MDNKFTFYLDRIHQKVLNWVILTQKENLQNKEASIICNNCIAGVIYYDLKQKFLSPTINLFFCSPDFLQFLSHLDIYLNKPLKFQNHSKYFGECNYPVGCLDEVEIHFLHYASEYEALEKWEIRKQRLNRNNLFVIGSDRDFCNERIVKQFIQLPFTQKVFFSSKPYKEKSIIYLPQYKNKNQIGDLIKDGKAWYFFLDIAHWLNTGKIKSPFLKKTYFRFYFFLRSLLS